MKDVAGGAFCSLRCFAALGIGGIGYHCLLSLAISRLWREKRVTLGIEGDLVADPDGLEGYGRKREIVVGVVLFHKLIEAECHIDWNVQDLALFAEVLVA